MKYIIVLTDGMADEPLQELNNQTPLEAARTPNLDMLAQEAEVGLAQMVPEGMNPGSDTANLSVMGYDPRIYYTGRSPLEALSIGVDMKEQDISFRCNLVTVSEDAPYEEKRMLDHSSDEISTEDAAILIDDLKKELLVEGYELYVGTGYRHLLVWQEGEVIELTPPHDILTKKIGGYLPINAVLRNMMEKSYDILNHHPLNEKRREQGLKPANAIWFWGAGTRPSLTSFQQKTNKKGVMISAVDLLKGIAVGANMLSIDVEGATGGLHTNYTGKAMAAVDALTCRGFDFAYIHIEAPDEMGHQGNLRDKIKAMEWIDEKVVGVLLREFRLRDVDYRILVVPDHPTPVRLRTHTKEAVPYLLFDSTNPLGKARKYCEKEAGKSGHIWKEGYLLMDHLLKI